MNSLASRTGIPLRHSVCTLGRSRSPGTRTPTRFGRRASLFPTPFSPGSAPLAMHAHEFVELAALVAAHGPVVVRQEGRLSPTSIEEYWTASRSRLDRWNRDLKDFSNDLKIGRPRPVQGTLAVCPLRARRDPRRRSAYPRLDRRIVCPRSPTGNRSCRTGRPKYSGQSPRYSSPCTDAVDRRTGDRARSGPPLKPPSAAGRTMD